VPLLDLAVRGDDNTDALGALRRIDICAVGRPDRAVRVADQGEVEVELLGELLVVRGSVERHAQDHCVLPIVVTLQVAEPATLSGSARRVGLGKEPEHDVLALEVGELHRVAVVVAPDEVRRLVPRIQHGPSFLNAPRPAGPQPRDGLRRALRGFERVQRARTISAGNASRASQSYGPSRSAMLSRKQPSARNCSTISRASFTAPRRYPVRSARAALPPKWLSKSASARAMPLASAPR